jgi:hypothetical protein
MLRPLVLSLVWLFPTALTSAQERVVVEPGQTLRDIAAEHLGKPDLWTELLVANNLSIGAVRPGMSLKLPQGPYREAFTALDTAATRLQQAIQVGAEVFAPDELARANDARDDALRLCRDRRPEDCYQRAQTAEQLAEAVFRSAEAKRKTSATARLAGREGKVQGKRVDDLVWNNLAQGDSLEVGQTLRTLSASRAEIRFVDDSVLRLGANSQAVIQAMQVDRLTRQRQAKVSLVEGDVYALLAEGGRSAFTLESGGVATGGRSRNFRIRQDGSKTRVANYDARSVAVESETERLTLNRNQGLVLSPETGEVSFQDLLPAPDLVRPAYRERVYTQAVSLGWGEVPGAASYRLEVARDSGFVEGVRVIEEITESAHTLKGLAPAVYFWRVAAVDSIGLTGPASVTHRFRVILNESAPFLTLRQPQAAVVEVREIELIGETEATARVTIDGSPVRVSGDGHFHHRVTLDPGPNRFRITAVNPAGIPNERQLTVRYRLRQTAPVTYAETLPRVADRHFITNQDELVLTGTTLPDARLTLYANGDRLTARGHAADNGAFQMGIPLRSGTQGFLVTIEDPDTGYLTRDWIAVTADSRPPQLRLAPIPAHTTAAQLTFTGRVIEGEQLTINGEAVPLDAGRFRTDRVLTAGENTFQFRVRDLAGNEIHPLYRVLRDTQPPELIRHRVEVRADRILVEAEAWDASSLQRTAEYQLQAEDGLHTGALVLTGDGYYRAVIPGWTGIGRPRLDSISVSDHLGNRRRYRVN